MLEIESGGSVLAETLPQPMDPKILGGLALRQVVDPVTLSLAEKYLEQSLDLLDVDDTNEFGACIAYGVDLTTESEDAVTATLVASAGAVNQALTTDDHQAGIDKIWNLPHLDRNKQVDLRRQHVPIVFDDGNINPNGTIFYLTSRKLVI